MVPVSKELINHCRKKESSHQKELFKLMYAPMYRLCFRYIGKQPESEDCVMKGFIKAFQNLNTFTWQNEKSFFYWLKKIMVNEALMELRRHSTLMLVPLENEIEVYETDDIFDKLSAEELYNLIASLPSGYKTVFNLYVIEGYTHAEIAKLLNTSESTSRTQLAKAKKKLKMQIEKMNLSYENGR